jgi:uncharacterized Fe-S cluster protein YjdI
MKKEYTNGEVTVVWQPGICTHSTICWNSLTGLSSVFNPSAKPWIKMEGASTERIIHQVRKCPSRALSFYMNNEAPKAPAETAAADAGTPEAKAIGPDCTVEVTPNGPLLVKGNILVKDAAGNETAHRQITALCRCGASANKPYCDGMHAKAGFKG